MPRCCEVALPVPLDQTFTYRLPEGVSAKPGARVIAPFRREQLIGVITALHDEEPEGVEVRSVSSILDAEPLLPLSLLDLARWIADYYLAPLGEVLRSMLPLTAETRRQVALRIAPVGLDLLAQSFDGGATRESSRRKTLTPDSIEFRVLSHLAEGEAVRLSTVRTATSATVLQINAMVRRKWIARESSAEERDARRLERFAVLIPDARLPALTDRQQLLMAELAAAGGEELLRDLYRRLPSQSTLQILVRRGLVRIEERPQSFRLTTLPSTSTLHSLNSSQAAALDVITAALGRFQSILLHGVTGSGKTAVYLAAMQQVLDRGQSALLLVPEIGLTPAITAQLDAAFGARVALLHSALTPQERAEQWHRIRRGEAPIVVGTRSAIFAPVPRLGLILVDEEHDASYKQEEAPRYHARDVAVMLAHLHGIPIVLGSATPSLESWQNAASGKYQLVRMEARIQDRPLPEVQLVDMREEYRQTGRDQLFSRLLTEEIHQTLERGEQAILLLNRRGYSFAILCRSCGEKLECVNCAIALTYHKPVSASESPAPVGQRLECHYCGYRRAVPARCPKCDSEHLYYLGAGSQQAEERLLEIFPGARIGRMDRDTVRGRMDMESLLRRLHSGEINLLVGTQMIAKGHDIHGVTTVGVVGCDYALAMPDFRAAERVFQLITQVSGRAGRGSLPGRVVVQTWYPDHYSILCAAGHDYARFAERELQYRRWMHYPPFGFLANLLFKSRSVDEASQWAERVAARLRTETVEGVRILGPCPAPIARVKDTWRFHLVVKASRRSALNTLLRSLVRDLDGMGIPRRNMIIDVDPQRLM